MGCLNSKGKRASAYESEFGAGSSSVGAYGGGYGNAQYTQQVIVPQAVLSAAAQQASGTPFAVSDNGKQFLQSAFGPYGVPAPQQPQPPMYGNGSHANQIPPPW
eukprot:TRINITY_DN24750_c0_g1_i1.p2 TRINITY_DN24750_c0_g1~~TRINITY_DN24750_c0_g1_i1.p2  ORF type:complete len:104 (+),score=34.46 TRINITY_DN24750_c0_g1_i1:148-459(+)